MNEKIDNLAGQALAELAMTGWDLETSPFNIFTKKFAELLIEQCVTCVKYTDKDHIFTAHDAGVVGAAHDRAMKSIRKHFGVEE